ncbi:MAG: hypothetical protein AAGA48_18210 [Myxococcota bacterium]
MAAHNLLVVSDLHLGEDVGRSIRTTEGLEAALVAFLDHHQDHGGPWRLVINGDMLEMVGIVMLPDQAPRVPDDLHPHDHRYGLGGREDAAAIKMRAMVEHHSTVFAGLGRFVGAGHALSIVIGNHDIELCWPAVQRVFTEGVVEGWRHDHPSESGDAIAKAVTFHPWFLYVPGVAWIEHGHQYDPYCSFEHLLEPVIDEVEVDPNIGGLLLRYLGSQFGDEVHEVVHRGTFAYLKLWASRGPLHMSKIFVAYFDMCRRLLEHYRLLGPDQVTRHQAKVADRVEDVARAAGLDVGLLYRLSDLWRPPVANQLGRLLRALMCDRVALLVAAPTVLMATLLVPAASQTLAALVLVPPLGLLIAAAAIAREPTDPRRAMRSQAKTVRKLVGVPFVVMGHSHDPVHLVDDDGAYLNTGTWTPRGDPYKTFTHVTIRHTAEGPRASLRQWRDGASRAMSR